MKVNLDPAELDELKVRIFMETAPAVKEESYLVDGEVSAMKNPPNSPTEGEMPSFPIQLPVTN